MARRGRIDLRNPGFNLNFNQADRLNHQQMQKRYADAQASNRVLDDMEYLAGQQGRRIDDLNDQDFANLEAEVLNQRQQPQARRQVVEPTEAKRKVGSRIPFARREADAQYKSAKKQRDKDIENNDILREMKKRAESRGRNFDEMGGFEQQLLDAEVSGGRALRKAAVPLGLGGAGALYFANQNEGGGTVGTDPLAAARNNVAGASALVNSDNVLSALVADDMEARAAAIEQQQMSLEAAAQPGFNDQVSALVDERAKQLQSVPIQRADGSVSPMPFDTAIRLAQEEIGIQLRAEGII